MLALKHHKKVVCVKGDTENPVTKGFLCSRGLKDPQRTYSPQRVLYPYLRDGKKPNGRFKRVSWEKALNTITVRLKKVLREYGSDAVLHLEYAGNMGLFTWFVAQRLWYAIGAARTDYSICSKSGHEAIGLHYGLSYGAQPEELLNMRLAVFWGFNAVVSSPHQWFLAFKSRKKGCKIVVVDSRKSRTAKKADLWIQPKLGSDVALAYGVARYLIENRKIDFKFISRWTVGFEEFKKEAMRWTPSRVEKYTGVSWDIVKEFGENYSNLKPNLIMIGLGFQKSFNGAEAVRAVSLLPALIGIHRGFYYSNSQGWSINLKLLTGEELTNKKFLTVSQVGLGKVLEKGRFKYVYIYNMNPAVTLPNQALVWKGLLREDVFVVVHETHWTETAKLADVVLPAPTYLEKEDVVISYSHGYIRKSQRVVEPLGESKDELWVTRQIAKKLNLKNKWLYKEPWEILKEALGEGFVEKLRSGKTLKLKPKPKNEYQTSSGKIELYSTKAKKLGCTPLPYQPKIPKKDFLVLLSSALSTYTHTQFQDVYGLIPSIVWINPKDAEKHGIKDGSQIILYNEYGNIRLKAIATDAVPQGVLWTPKGGLDLDKKPKNQISPDLTQKIGGGPVFNSTLVKVKPANFST